MEFEGSRGAGAPSAPLAASVAGIEYLDMICNFPFNLFSIQVYTKLLYFLKRKGRDGTISTTV
jgi:peptidoglycan biosynthesis protein MviN/MurJ (putative lipid II flippase)